ncbi:MAG: helix-turn-helix domain-containing protein, partial [Cytophagales bacterium]|nr:helix-turn-helix domain-containing protein [Cytophagales bacterium]
PIPVIHGKWAFSVYHTAEKEDEKIRPALEKPAKGETKFISLRMFQEGLPIPEIAESRNMSPATIEGHLASFVLTGEIDILQIISESKLAVIMETLSTLGEVSSSVVKEKLGAEFSYSDIKAVQAHIKRTSDIKADQVPF